MKQLGVLPVSKFKKGRLGTSVHIVKITSYQKNNPITRNNYLLKISKFTGLRAVKVRQNSIQISLIRKSKPPNPYSL